MEAKQEKSVFTMTNKFDDEDEQLAGYGCPVCGYPVVIESGLEVCYHCGWSNDDEPEGYFEE